MGGGMTLQDGGAAGPPCCGGAIPSCGCGGTMPGCGITAAARGVERTGERERGLVEMGLGRVYACEPGKDIFASAGLRRLAELQGGLCKTSCRCFLLLLQCITPQKMFFNGL
jgi:hypothetical protein